jgi:hypothetical protein
MDGVLFAAEPPIRNQYTLFDENMVCVSLFFYLTGHKNVDNMKIYSKFSVINGYRNTLLGISETKAAHRYIEHDNIKIELRGIYMRILTGFAWLI